MLRFSASISNQKHYIWCKRKKDATKSCNWYFSILNIFVACFAAAYLYVSYYHYLLAVSVPFLLCINWFICCFLFCWFFCLLPDSIEQAWHSWQREVVVGTLCGVRSVGLESPQRVKLLQRVRFEAMLQYSSMAVQTPNPYIRIAKCHDFHF